MYSLDDVKTALEMETLSDSLYKMERFAVENKLQLLANWCDLEINGYSNPEDAKALNIGRYRKITVTWYDSIYRKVRLLNSPHHFSTTQILLNPIRELEKNVSFNKEYSIYTDAHKVSELNSNHDFYVVSPFDFRTSISFGMLAIEDIRDWLGRIHIQARSYLHESELLLKQSQLIYSSPNFRKLVTDIDLAKVLARRWEEAIQSFQAGAYLGTVILLGSILEGVLLSKIEQNSLQSNSASKCPKDRTGKPLAFEAWKLQSLIEVAHECGWLKKQYKDFSHVVRDYRNFVHPNKERQEGVIFDANLCKVIFEVVSAALA